MDLNRNSYLHRDALDGRKLTIAVNQPITAVESHGLTQAGRLRKFMRVNRARYLLMQQDLAWATERRALIVGAQCLDWQLPDTSTLICWPLDNAVFFASLSSEGFNMIEADSEMICSCEDALEVLNNSHTSVLILPGGALSARLEVAGYPANAEQTLQDSPRYRTRSAALVFTQHRLPHPAHALLLLLLLGGYSAHSLIPAEEERHIVQLMEPPSGSPALVGELRALRAATRDLTVLTLHGLHRLTWQAGTGEVLVSGQLGEDNLNRINKIARELDTKLEVKGKAWQLTYPQPVTRPGEQSLQPIDIEVERLVQPGRAAGFAVTITGDRRAGGAPISLQGGLRLISRDYVETELVLTAASQASLAAIALLLSRLTALDPWPNATLSEASVELAESGLMSMRLSILVRGHKRHLEGEA